MPKPSSSATSLQFDLIAHLFDSACVRARALAAARTAEEFEQARAQLAQHLRIMSLCVDSSVTGRSNTLHATYSYLQTVIATGAFTERVALGQECIALIERIELGGQRLKQSA